jgi:PAS domain-containing protein
VIDNTLKQLGTLLEASTLGLIAIGQDHTVISTNARLDHVFGYAPGELLGSAIELQSEFGNGSTFSFRLTQE